MTDTNKKSLIGFRATEEEKNIIKNKAFQSNMSISDYIKCRLLEDGDKDEIKLTDYEKLQITCSIKSFFLLQEMINPTKKLENINRIRSSVKQADKFLVEQGFKTQEEFDKLYNTNSNNN
jgi:hypothetical protein